MKRKSEWHHRKLQRPRVTAKKTLEPEKAREVRKQNRLASRQRRRSTRR